MNTSRNYRYSFFLSIVIGSCIVAIVLLVYAIYGAVVETVPTPSYQEKNLEILKTAKPNDLVLCVSANKDSSLQPDIWAAILVEQNDGAYLRGYSLNSHQLYQIPIGGYPYTKFSKCEIRIVKEPFAMETIGRIIMYGLNPPPAK